MKNIFKILLPLTVGILVALILEITIGWWGFRVIFPWIGFSITIGTFLRWILKGRKRLIGRKIAILMILPCLLLFVPIVNHENFQLGGVVLIVLIGFFSKGFIHYAIAKIFGPLIWGRGFCGWACWTGAVLDWLPITKPKKEVNKKTRHLRFVSLFISFSIPIYLIFVLNYDVRTNYIYKKEIIWMFTGNAIYYLLAIPLAFIYSDKRFFCKNICPVALVMKPTSSLSLIKIKPKGNECIQCKSCNNICPMGVDVMGYIKNNKAVSDTECIHCRDCSVVCPVNAV